MKKHYLFFASLTYAYSILRPLQEEIHRRGDIVAWYLEDSCPDLLEKHEIRLKTFDEVFRFNPIAVFVPGNWVYDFFPGVKVEVFHGYPMKKRIEKLTTILPYVVGSIYIVHKVRVVHPISPIWKKNTAISRYTKPAGAK